MRTLLRCLSALVLAIAVFSLAAAFAFPARAQSFTTFDDWMLGCDNRRHCVALGLEPGENVNGVYVRVLRSGEGAPSPRSRSPLLAMRGRCGSPLTIPRFRLSLDWRQANLNAANLSR